ncbi:MAG TPA: insulinase family protein, partial [Kofleriaceae bacterium]|nr:insulinase family protein [Kofleriaceae bacterium]
LPLPGDRHETVDQALSRLALEYNANTGWDRTHYYAQGLVDALPELLAVEMSRLGTDCRTLSPDLFAREREVVRNEIRQRGGIGDQLLQYVLEAAYPEGHPYRRPIGGDDRQLAAVTLDDVCTFMAAHYAPANATLIVAGATTADEVKKILNQHLGSLPPRPATASVKVPLVRLTTRVVERTLAIEEPTAVAIYALPPTFGLDSVPAAYAQAELASRIADQADGKDWITDTVVTQLGGVRAPVLIVGVTVREAGQLHKAIEFIDAQVHKLKFEATEFQLSMVREAAQIGVLERAERLTSRAMMFADYLQFDSDLGFVVGDLERLGQLTISDVQEVAGGIFARRGVLLVRPDPKAVYKERRADLTFSPSAHGQDERVGDVDLADAERSLALPGSHLSATQLRRFTLDSGLQVLLLPASTLPLIDIRLIVAAGSAQDPPGKAGVAELAAQLMVPAMDTFDRQRDLFDFYRMGGRFSPEVSADFTVFRVRGASVFLDGLVHGLGVLMRSGRYDGDLVGKIRNLRATAVDKKDAVRERRLETVVGRALYGQDHPYARMVERTGAGLRSIGAGDLDGFRRRYYVPRNATLVIAGRFDPDLMEQHVRHAFAGWSSGQAGFAGVVEPAHTHAVTTAVDDDDGVLLGVQLAYPTGAGMDEHYAARLVLQEMLDQRLRVVRERLGASYGVYARYEVQRGPGVLHVFGAVDGARGGEGLTAIRAAIDGLRRSDEAFVRDFVRARRTVGRRLVADATDSGSLADQLSQIAEYGKSDRYFGVLVDAVSRLRPGDVAAVAAADLAAEHETLVVAADRPVVEAAFKAAGLPPPHFVP